MRKRDYRPYCFDSCNEPLKTRYSMLLEKINNIHVDVPEVSVTATAKIDEAVLNKAVADAIKKNPVNVAVDIDSESIAESLGNDFRKVHAHITRAENEIIESLSCNCSGEGDGCGCASDDSKIQEGIDKILTVLDVDSVKDAIEEATATVKSHVDKGVDAVNEHVAQTALLTSNDVVDRINAQVDSNANDIKAKVDDAAANVIVEVRAVDKNASDRDDLITMTVLNSETHLSSTISESKTELLNSDIATRNLVESRSNQIEDKVAKVTVDTAAMINEVKSQISDFRELYESFHD